MAKITITLEDGENDEVLMTVDTNEPFPQESEAATGAQVLSLIAFGAIQDEMERRREAV